jgi:hypothetical protein
LFSIKSCALTVCEYPCLCSPPSLSGIVEGRRLFQLCELASDSGEGPAVAGYVDKESAGPSVSVEEAVEEYDDCFLEQGPSSASHDVNWER